MKGISNSMLVVSRGRNQAVLVGNDVKVTVLDIRTGEAAVGGGSVRLGFQAPSEIPIHREEILDRAQPKTSSQAHKPKREIPGTSLPVRDATVRLQIEAPPEISIHCSRASGDASGHRRIVPPPSTESSTADEAHPSGGPPMRVIDCRNQDNILIGNQLLITIVGVFRFVADPAPPRSK